VPARHGGFETAAENIGLELVRRGWRVIVYCQKSGAGSGIEEDTWRGIERVHVPERFAGPVGTIWFDTIAMRHAAKHGDLCLSFGYNTAFLNERLRAKGVPTIINMDGVEWKRARWSRAQRQFLHLNERLACRLGDHLIADHPEIHRHLSRIANPAKISTIAYGSRSVTRADAGHLEPFGVEPKQYLTLIARPVAENSILEMVTSFSRRPRGVKLLVLGTYSETDPYHQAVRAAASDDVVFAGGVYDPAATDALRFHSLAYVHGHTVGGTNPSLVEALGCGNAVIAHDNPFNRWVAQDAALYFADEDGFDIALDRLLDSPQLVASMSGNARTRHAAEFEWSRITDQYERLLLAHHPVVTTTAVRVPAQTRSSATQAAQPVPDVAAASTLPQQRSSRQSAEVTQGRPSAR
jgi:glycosyltransferase involved in cell wall biosynthesis